MYTDDAKYLAWNLAAMSPWMRVDEPQDPRRKANALPLVATVAREGFRSPNKMTNIIAASKRHLEEILKFKRGVVEHQDFVRERDTVGMAIKRWDSQGGSWRLQVLNALLVEVMETLRSWPAEDTAGKFVPISYLFCQRVLNSSIPRWTIFFRFPH